MFPPVKIHAEKGCVFSDKPEMIITQGVSSDGKGGESGRESKLASGIYFKRCDGSFKNVKGERLELTTSDGAT